MKAIWNNQTVAEADKAGLIRIEGNWYFPPESLKTEYFSSSDYETVCHWKGVANYYDINVDGQSNETAAWRYVAPLEGSVERVGKDFSDYVAFWHGVDIQE